MRCHIDGLGFESRLKAELTDGTNALIHKSGTTFRFKKRLHRDLQLGRVPTLIHPTVRARYEADDSYRPPCLKALVDEVGWKDINVGD